MVEAMTGFGAKKHVVSAGMPRSGSTWQYNILRMLLEPLGAYCCWTAEYDEDDLRQIHLIKAHNPEAGKVPDGAIVVTSIRDLRAVAGSMVRMRWIADDPLALVDMCQNYVLAFEHLEHRARHVARYEAILDDPIGEAQAIEMAVGLTRPSRAQEAVNAVDSMRPPDGQPAGTFTAYDPATHLHAGHIGSKTNWRAIRNLSTAATTAIEAELGPWLVSKGYPVPLVGPQG